VLLAVTSNVPSTGSTIRRVRSQSPTGCRPKTTRTITIATAVMAIAMSCGGLMRTHLRLSNIDRTGFTVRPRRKPVRAARFDRPKFLR
jgi:hypothetical protein